MNQNRQILETGVQENQRNIIVNRKYKDTLFRMVFREKKNLLSLYNALNGTSYTNPDDLEITTLEDAIYIGMKNDISFLISNTMNLYEHQSTFNPNMPLRGLFYIARVYQNYIKKQDEDLYGKKLIALPMPRYVVFYNGVEDVEDYQELKLSDAFILPKGAEVSVPLECKAIVLNINLGHNQELLESCRALWEYSYFVNEVRVNQDKGMKIEDAIQTAQKTCMDKDIMKEFLENHSAEVKDVILEEFDREWHEAKLQEESRKEGHEEGVREGLERGRSEGIRFKTLVQKLMEDGRTEELTKALEDEQVCGQLYEEYEL